MARDFDGNDYIHMDTAQVPGDYEFTMSAWVQDDRLTTGVSTAIGLGNTGSSTDFFILGTYWNGVNRTPAVWFKETAGGVNNLIQNTGSSVGGSSWYHLAAVITAGSVTLYLNGVEVTNLEVGLATSPSFNSLDIGACQIGGLAQYWDGRLAECAVWQSVLNAEQIASLAKGFSPRCFPSGLYMYTPIFDNYSTRVMNFGADPDGSLDGAPVGTNAFSGHPSIYYPSVFNADLPSTYVAPTIGKVTLGDIGPFNVKVGDTKSLKLHHRIPPNTTFNVTSENASGRVKIIYHKRG